MSTKLIGTAPDQVPTNADLGTMAFQDKENVNFLDGRGALQHLDITKISQQLNVTGSFIFIYDTSKDSDGGAWRTRCQGTSWYNETLNTTTRGARREFPSVAVIVSDSAGAVTIYDGDEPTLPMWMKFNTDGVISWATGATATIGPIYALNSHLALGVNGGSGGGSVHVNFAKDDMKLSYNTAYQLKWRTIINRNILRSVVGLLYTSGGDGYILNNITIFDIAMAVAPGAQLDPITGLPNPTIAIATQSGLNIIKSDGSIVMGSQANSSWLVGEVFFDSYQNVWMRESTDWAYGGLQLASVFPYYSVATIGDSSGTGNGYLQEGITSTTYGGNAALPRIRGGGITSLTGAGPLVVVGSSTQNGSAIGKAGGLTFVYDNPQDRTRSAMAYVTAKFNSGWMPGNTRRALLSDITQETLVATELVTNGSFSSGTTGWTTSQGGGTGTFTVSSGTLVLTQAGTSVWMRAAQSFATVPGKWYTLSVNITGQTNANWSIYVGTSENVNDTAEYGYNTGIIHPVNNGTNIFQFQATGATTWITFRQGGGVGVAGSIGAVSCRLGDPDRTYYSAGLQAYGSVTKTPVATGADLVAYGNWSSSNHLKQPYSSAWDFDTGDFCLITWLKLDTYTTYSELIDIADGSNTNRLEWLVNSNGGIYLYLGSTGIANISSNYAVTLGNWNQIITCRKNGVVKHYANGVLVYTGTNTGDVANTNCSLYVGVNYNGNNGNGQMALLRMSTTVPTDEQIIRMYNDEKELFQENAKAVIYGTGEAVTAVAYDEDTKLVHAGTSSGRSVFQGLRRIDNTTTAVSNSISAANGLVVEN